MEGGCDKCVNNACEQCTVEGKSVESNCNCEPG